MRRPAPLRRRWASCLLIAGLCMAGPLSSRAQTFASIPVDAPATLTTPDTGSPPRVTVRVQAADAAALARFLGQPEGDDTRRGSLVLTLQAHRQAELDVAVDTLAASFIIDHADAAVQDLKARLQQQRAGQPVDAAAVVAFVAGVMRSEPAQISFASEVARQLRGDCTEHALLSAALARSLGIPARVVHGAALLPVDGQWQAYGHAWIQTHEAGRWVLRDSALFQAPGPVYYLPAFVLGNEGPGHRLAMLQGLARLPSRIEVVAVDQGL
jgi:Transglutaminase-like superfamily